MRKLFTFSIFCFFLIVKAQSPFNEHVVINNIIDGAIFDIDHSDIDNDGDIDIVGVTNSSVFIIENVNSSYFSSRNILIDRVGYPSYLTKVEIGDIDGDSIDDLVVVARDSNKIFWYKNLGNFLFSSRHTITNTINKPWGMSCFDVDNDGDIDVVSGSYIDNKLYWIENDGSGNFVNEFLINDITYNTLTEINSVDLDDDGLIDILASTNFKTVYFKNLGNGNFGPLQTFFTVTNSEAVSIEAVDIDNDGDLDVFCAYQNNGEIYWKENLGSGNFAPRTLLISNLTRLKDLLAYDADNDGVKELLSSEFGSLYYYKSTGGGNFSKTLFSPLLHGASELITFQNNNNSIDNFFYIGNGSVYELKDTSTSPFINSICLISNTTTNNSLTNALAEDYDNDGDLDIVIASNRISFYENKGGGVFVNSKIIQDKTFATYNVYFNDLDADGLNDLLFTRDYSTLNIDSSDIAWCRNLGNGNYDTAQIFTPFSGVTYPVLIFSDDISNNGFNDILVSRYENGMTHDTYIKTNLGGGSFSGWTRLNYHGSGKIISLDKDNDGDIDLLSLYGQVYYHRKINSNLWDVNGTIVTDNSTKDFEIDDLDNDGFEDVVAIASNFNGLISYKNMGSAQTTPIFGNLDTLLETSFPITEFELVDLDGDGDKEVIYISAIDNKLVWCENLANGNYGSENILNSTLFNVTDLICKDFDKDGSIDIYVSSENGLKTSIYKNNLVQYIKKIRVFPFVDYNQNGILDSNENAFKNHSITLSPQNISSINTADFVQFYFDSTSLSSINLNVNTNVWVPSDSLNRTLFIDTNNIIDSLYIGVSPINDVLTNLTMSSSWPRCQRNVAHFFTVENEGNLIDTGYFEINYSDSIVFTSSSSNATIINGNTLRIGFNNILSSESFTNTTYFLLPQNIQNLDYIVKTYIQDGSFILSDSIFFQQEVACSFDPNDKNVFPNYGNKGYILNDDNELEYLIRFQNTGNDTAYNVLLLDTLNSNLDISSFKILSYSHPLNININNNNGLVEFIFNDINLLDSTSNFDESQGYVKYAIQPLSNLQVGETIENRASIFFDLNPPIITNTTLNTIYSCESIVDDILLPNPYENCFLSNYEVILQNNFINKIEWFWNDTLISVDSTANYILNNAEVNNLRVLVQNDLCKIDSTFELFINNPIIEIIDTFTTSYTAPSGNEIWTESGVYYDTITSSLLCDSLVILYLHKDDFTKISQINNINVSVYPNPTSKFLHIKLDAQVDETNLISIEIYDSIGNSVFNKSYKKNEIDVNLINLNKGLYTIKLSNNKRVSFVKILKI